MGRLCEELKSGPVKKFCKALLQLAEQSDGYFEPVKQDFLDLFYKHVESKWINGSLPEGEYRQKGNAFRDFISELIYIRSKGQYRLFDMKVPGYTERNHDVDLAFVRDDGLLVVAGEVKMTGSPAHKVGSTTQKERKTQSDLDKRLKEVKFTSVDLKLHYTPDKTITKIVQSILDDCSESDKDVPKNRWWDEWIKNSIPGFYSFWASRLASGRVGKKGQIVDADNPDLLLKKFENLKKYNNAVGVFLFKEDSGKYVPVEENEIKKRGLRIDDAIDDLIKFLNEHID